MKIVNNQGLDVTLSSMFSKISESYEVEKEKFKKNFENEFIKPYKKQVIDYAKTNSVCKGVKFKDEYDEEADDIVIGDEYKIDGFRFLVKCHYLTKSGKVSKRSKEFFMPVQEIINQYKMIEV